MPLSFLIENVILPTHMSMEQALLLFQVDDHLSAAQIRSLLGILNLYGIEILDDLRVGKDLGSPLWPLLVL